MMKGFTVVEILVALALVGVVLAMVISNTISAGRCTERIVRGQRHLEGIFHAVDAMRSDLVKCGMRVRQASIRFGFPMFINDPHSFKVLYGLWEEGFLEEGWEGDRFVTVNCSDFFQRRKKILLYDTESGCWEFNEIEVPEKERIILKEPLRNHYSVHAMAVALKEVEYKIYAKQQVLKRKVNRGYFQPVLEGVTDFYIQFYPESRSLLYRIEIGKKEQIRGYIFLINMMEGGK